jgi:hypothetical protein
MKLHMGPKYLHYLRKLWQRGEIGMEPTVRIFTRGPQVCIIAGGLDHTYCGRSYEDQIPLSSIASVEAVEPCKRCFHDEAEINLLLGLRKESPS